MRFKRVLLVSAHADDALVGAGGYALRLRKEGAELTHVVFTLSEKDNGLGFTGSEIRGELEEATTLMETDLSIIQTPVHYLQKYGANIRKALEDLKETWHPDLILMPFLQDTHQDHRAVAEETIRVFRNSETVLSYELPRNTITTFQPNVFANITDELEEKLHVLACFKTQVKRPYMAPECFRALARVRGTMFGVSYAEAFMAVKMVL